MFSSIESCQLKDLYQLLLECSQILYGCMWLGKLNNTFLKRLKHCWHIQRYQYNFSTFIFIENIFRMVKYTSIIKRNLNFNPSSSKYFFTSVMKPYWYHSVNKNAITDTFDYVDRTQTDHFCSCFSFFLPEYIVFLFCFLD